MIPVLCSGFHLAEPATAWFYNKTRHYTVEVCDGRPIFLCVRSVIHSLCSIANSYSDLKIENHLLLSQTDSVGVACCTGLELWGY